MDNQILIDQLRSQGALQRQAELLRQQQQNYGQAIPNPQFSVGTPGYSARIGNSVINMPGQTQVNYGDIIGKGLANFLSARAGKQAAEKEDQASQINQEFMMSTLQNDPQATKLYAAAKAGLPGAAKALAEHMAPKKEAMAGFLQAATSGAADPELLGEIAPRYGIDPEIGKKAGAYAIAQKEKTAQMKLDNQRTLLQDRMGMQRGLMQERMGLQLENAKTLKGIPQARYGKGGMEVTGGGKTYEIDGVPVSPYELTAGERQMRAKQLEKSSETIAKGEAQIAKFPDVWKAFNTPGQFGPVQKAAETMSSSNLPLVTSIGIGMRSKGAALLADYINSETLSRMAQLGGNDSNEELRRMQSSLPTALNSRETMKALLIRMDAWQKRTMEALKAKRGDIQSGKFYDPRSEGDADYYSKAKQPEITNDYSPQKSGSAAPSPDMFPKAKGKPTKNIDDWLDEQGIK